MRLLDQRVAAGPGWGRTGPCGWCRCRRCSSRTSHGCGSGTGTGAGGSVAGRWLGVGGVGSGERLVGDRRQVDFAAVLGGEPVGRDEVDVAASPRCREAGTSDRSASTNTTSSGCGSGTGSGTGSTPGSGSGHSMRLSGGLSVAASSRFLPRRRSMRSLAPRRRAGTPSPHTRWWPRCRRPTSPPRCALFDLADLGTVGLHLARVGTRHGVGHGDGGRRWGGRIGPASGRRAGVVASGSCRPAGTITRSAECRLDAEVGAALLVGAIDRGPSVDERVLAERLRLTDGSVGRDDLSAGAHLDVRELPGRDAVEDGFDRDEPAVPVISGHPRTIHVGPAGDHDVERDLPGLLLGGRSGSPLRRSPAVDGRRRGLVAQPLPASQGWPSTTVVTVHSDEAGDRRRTWRFRSTRRTTRLRRRSR